MPGPFNYPSKPPVNRSPPSYSSVKPHKKPAIRTSFCGAASAAEEDDYPDKQKLSPGEHKQIRNVRVRVICTDPDATDSSSDEEGGYQPSRTCHMKKRVVRELFLPASQLALSAFPNCQGECHAEMKLFSRKKTNNASKSFSACSVTKKWAAKSSTASSASKRGGFMGVSGRRRCGKWAAEIWDSSRRFGSSEAAASAYDDATIHLKGSEAQRSFAGAQPECSVDSKGDESSVISDKSQVSRSLEPLASFDSLHSASFSNSDNAESCDSDFRTDFPCKVKDHVLNHELSLRTVAVGDSDDEGLSDILSSEWADGYDSDMVDAGTESKASLSPPLSTSDFSCLIDCVEKEVAKENVKLEPSKESVVLSFPMLEEPSFFEDFGRILENDFGRLDEFPTRTGADFNFELDSEALSWIDVPGSWQCVV